MQTLIRLVLLVLAAVSAGGAVAADAAAPTVFITGANRGIGLELVRQYAERGWHVIAAARKPAEATQLQQIASKHALVQIEALNLMDHSSIDAVALRLKGQPVDLLIHNAGTSGGPEAQVFGRMRYDAFREALEVNAIAPLKLTEALVDNIAASGQKKVILMGTSEASFAAIDAARLYFYRGSKAAAHMLMLNLAYELKPRGIAVGVINPGPVDTDMMKGVRMPLQPPAVAVGKVIAVIDRLDVASTGKFWNYSGGNVAW